MEMFQVPLCSTYTNLTNMVKSTVLLIDAYFLLQRPLPHN